MLTELEVSAKTDLIEGISDKWIKIHFNGSYGWVFRGFLSKEYVSSNSGDEKKQSEEEAIKKIHEQLNHSASEYSRKCREKPELCVGNDY